MDLHFPRLHTVFWPLQEAGWRPLSCLWLYHLPSLSPPGFPFFLFTYSQVYYIEALEDPSQQAKYWHCAENCAIPTYRLGWVMIHIRPFCYSIYTGILLFLNRSNYYGKVSWSVNQPRGIQIYAFRQQNSQHSPAHSMAKIKKSKTNMHSVLVPLKIMYSVCYCRKGIFRERQVKIYMAIQIHTAFSFWEKSCVIPAPLHSQYRQSKGLQYLLLWWLSACWEGFFSPHRLQPTVISQPCYLWLCNLFPWK